MHYLFWPTDASFVQAGECPPIYGVSCSVAMQVPSPGLFRFFCVSLHTVFVLHFCSGHEFTEYFLSHFVKLRLLVSVPLYFLPLKQDLSILF